MVDALATAAESSKDGLPVSSPVWAEASPAGFTICTQPVLGFDVAVVGDEFGPEPEIDLEDRETRIDELGRAPIQGGLPGVAVIARRSGDCLFVELSPAFLDQAIGADVELGCGVGVHETTIESRGGTEQLVGALVPEETSFVVIPQGIGSRTAIRPVDGMVIYTSSASSRPVELFAFRADGEAIELD